MESDEEGPVTDSSEEDPSAETQVSVIARPADPVVALVEEVVSDPDSERVA